MSYLPRISWLLLVIASGCVTAAQKAQLLPRSEWPDQGNPPAEVIPYLAGVFQRREDGVMAGSGVIIHSSVAHGTYVLTANHVVEGSDDPGVWLYDYSRMGAERERSGALRAGLHAVDARVVLPRRSRSWFRSNLDEILEEFQTRVRSFTRDYAILKLDTRDLYHTISIHPGLASDVGQDDRVIAASIYPVRYPHFHAFQWNRRPSPQSILPGHSGSPILYEGRLFALLTRYHKVTRQIEESVDIGKIRKELKEVGMEFLLELDDGL